MSVSIIETLQNAEYNLDNVMKTSILSSLALPLAKSQLHNAIVLLEKGYNIWTQVEPLLEQGGRVEDVPEIDENDDINQDS